MAYVPGGGGSSAAAAIKQVEIDFGAMATNAQRFVVTDPDIQPTTRIVVSQSGEAATGKTADENELDVLLLRASPGAGAFTLYVNALHGFLVGRYRVNYSHN